MKPKETFFVADQSERQNSNPRKNMIGGLSRVPCDLLFAFVFFEHCILCVCNTPPQRKLPARHVGNKGGISQDKDKDADKDKDKDEDEDKDKTRQDWRNKQTNTQKTHTNK